MTVAIQSSEAHLTPPDRDSLANSVADTLRNLYDFPSMTSGEVLDLVSSSDSPIEGRLPIQLLEALLQPEGTTSSKSISSWKELITEIQKHNRSSNSCLGMLFASVLNNHDTRATTTNTTEKEPSLDQRLEVLLHLAIAVQQTRLRSQNQPSPLQQQQQPQLAASDDRTSAPDDENSFPSLPLELPSHFTPEQCALVKSCYQHMHRDYENRLQGLHQRLRLLQSNCGTGNQSSPGSGGKLPTAHALPMIDVQKSLSGAVSSSSTGSSFVGGSNQPQNAAPSPVTVRTTPHTIVEDRGGRVDVAEDRSPVMPEWTDERRHDDTTATGGRGRKGGGRGGNKGRGGGRGGRGAGRNNKSHSRK